MNFRDEMNDMFHRLVNGEIEVKPWEQWWNAHIKELTKALSPGDLIRVKPPAGRPCDYDAMCKCQQGAAYYFYKLGRPVKNISDYYERKAQEEKRHREQETMRAFHAHMTPVREKWETYLQAHPYVPVEFDWNARLGTPPGQTALSIPDTYPVRSTEWMKENRKIMQQRLKENMRAKIAPLAKAYGMKSAGAKTFIREQNGIVTYLNFIGYFRGGGYECMEYEMFPLYDIRSGILNLPADVCYSRNFRNMHENWGVIQYDLESVDTEKINHKFDQILTFLAEEVFPRWQQIDSLETFFAGERQAYFQAARTAPPDLPTNALLRSKQSSYMEDRPHPWHADEYLFGVWDLLSGNMDAGYERLRRCVEAGEEYKAICVQDKRTMNPNDPRDPLAVLYYNAELFYRTREQKGEIARTQAVQAVYDDVCRFMRYYHKLDKKVER